MVCYVPGQERKVSIHVHPDGSVQVDAPENENLDNIKKAVLKRARWIINHVNQANSQMESVLPREYISGETHMYLGRRYMLKVVAVESKNQTDVKLLRGQLRIYTTDKSRSNVKALLWKWYRDHAKDYFSRCIQTLVSEIPWIIEGPEWQLLVMKKQWGSCSPKGRLSLNPHLVKAPRECIKYVICHELCHLREHNHSKHFYELLSGLVPEWKSVKSRLDGMAEIFLNE
jgi:predicted metal-dependent hydrolase